jgi:pantetheine-phosphate adenylyltransferase
VTNGHIDIMRRSVRLFDKLIVAVSLNPKKAPAFSQEKRVQFISAATNDIENIEIVPFDSLLPRFADENHATVIIKGLRAISDFEFELQMGLMNRNLDDSIETLFMIPSQEFSFLSSNLVKEVANHGGDNSKLVPPEVLQGFQEIDL